MSEHDSNPGRAGAALGRTLIIANPVAQSGAGKRIAGQLQRFLALYHHDNASFELVYTEHMGHAVELAEAARDYDSVLALGGDGVVHEVANGIMRIGVEHRPALGVVPVSSGNDFRANAWPRRLWRKGFRSHSHMRARLPRRGTRDTVSGGRSRAPNPMVAGEWGGIAPPTQPKAPQRPYRRTSYLREKSQAPPTIR